MESKWISIISPLQPTQETRKPSRRWMNEKNSHLTFADTIRSHIRFFGSKFVFVWHMCSTIADGQTAYGLPKRPTQTFLFGFQTKLLILKYQNLWAVPVLMGLSVPDIYKLNCLPSHRLIVVKLKLHFIFLDNRNDDEKRRIFRRPPKRNNVHRADIECN